MKPISAISHIPLQRSSRKMKYFVIALFAIFAMVVAGPINISDNNIGDIVNVGVNANLNISSEVNQNIVNVIVALLNQELGIIALDEDGTPKAPNLPFSPNALPQRG